MKIDTFKLERYFAKYEFSAPYLLSSSDCEPYSLQELLDMADDDSLRLWKNLKLGYTDSRGNPILREEIAKLYESINPDDILVMAPEEGIFIAMNVLLNSGDHIIATFPGYQSLYEIANSIGCNVTKWLPENKDGWCFSTKRLKELLTENTRLIVINFPHNPTGATIKLEELQEIIDIARSRNILIFSDEMYRFLELDNTLQNPSVCDLYENSLTLFGMSKSFALAGLRIGWLVSKNPELFDKLSAFKDYTTICNSGPSEILSIIALRAKDVILTRNRNIISDNLNLLDSFFNQYSNLFKWHRPNAGTIAFPGLNENFDVNEFCLNLVNDLGVMLLPAGVYDFEGNNFRIGFGRKNMAEALLKLQEYLEKHHVIS
jgi:aspartate/methionine/tyrosine aminotransferase